MFTSKWTKRLPRKTRRAKEAPPTDTQPPPVQPRPARMTRKRKREMESLSHQEAPPRDCRFSEMTDAQAALAKRLRIGQTKDLRAALSDMGLFHLDTDTVFDTDGDKCRPRRGLQATWCGVQVHILDTFMCHRVFRADIAELRPHRSQVNCRVLGPVHTVRADDLQGVRLDFLLTLKNGSAVLEALPAQLASADLPLHADGETAAEELQEPRIQEYVEIQPSSAEEHVKWAAKYGFAHKVLPEKGREEVRFLLDLPLPRPFVAQAYRCSTCRNGQPLMDYIPIQEVPKLPPAAKQTYFASTAKDIKAVFPQALVCNLPREAPVYFSKQFFFHIAQV